MRVQVAERLRDVIYGVLVLLLIPIVWPLFRMTVRGARHLRTRGILVARHRSYWDVPILCLACGPFRRINFLARDTLLRHPVFAPIVWGLATVIDREDFGRQDFRRALAAADQARFLGIFPEGTTRAGSTPKTGALRLAARFNRPLIPVNLLPHGPYPPRYPFRFPRVEVRIGAPVHLADLEQDLPEVSRRSERFRVLTERLMRRIDAI